MRHMMIAAITDTISTTVSGIRLAIDVVTGLMTRGLRAPSNARLLLVRLTAHVPAGLPVANMRHMQPAGTGAAQVLERYCPSTLRSRPFRRWAKSGSGASLRRF